MPSSDTALVLLSGVSGAVMLQRHFLCFQQPSFTVYHFTTAVTTASAAVAAHKLLQGYIQASAQPSSQRRCLQEIQARRELKILYSYAAGISDCRPRAAPGPHPGRSAAAASALLPAMWEQ